MRALFHWPGLGDQPALHKQRGSTWFDLRRSQGPPEERGQLSQSLHPIRLVCPPTVLKKAFPCQTRQNPRPVGRGRSYTHKQKRRTWRRPRRSKQTATERCHGLAPKYYEGRSTERQSKCIQAQPVDPRCRLKQTTKPNSLKKTSHPAPNPARVGPPPRFSSRQQQAASAAAAASASPLFLKMPNPGRGLSVLLTFFTRPIQFPDCGVDRNRFDPRLQSSGSFCDSFWMGASSSHDGIHPCNVEVYPSSRRRERRAKLPKGVGCCRLFGPRFGATIGGGRARSTHRSIQALKNLRMTEGWALGWPQRARNGGPSGVIWSVEGSLASVR